MFHSELSMFLNVLNKVRGITYQGILLTLYRKNPQQFDFKASEIKQTSNNHRHRNYKQL